MSTHVSYCYICTGKYRSLFYIYQIIVCNFWLFTVILYDSCPSIKCSKIHTKCHLFEHFALVFFVRRLEMEHISGKKVAK